MLGHYKTAEAVVFPLLRKLTYNFKKKKKTDAMEKQNTTVRVV